MKASIREIYDIAAAIIRDAKTSGRTIKTPNSFTSYSFKRDDLRLEIFVPHNGREWDNDNDCWYFPRGSVTLYHEKHKNYIKAQTQFNVGSAASKSNFNPTRIVARILEPKFFKLLDIAESTTMDRSEIINAQLSKLRLKQK